MSRELNDLIPEFRIKVEQLLSKCEASGYPMRQYFTIRTPMEQGKLWRQSRSAEQIDQKINELYSNGADFLAHCIESAGIQSGNHVTNAIPGLSWHQWGEAVDCFWLVNGNSEWSTRIKLNGLNGYANYGTIAQSMGLTAGGFWPTLKDWPHIQLRSDSNPSRLYSLQHINEVMADRFGNIT